MESADRRRILGMGLAGACTTVAASLATAAGGRNDETIPELNFRVGSGYVPDLSAQAQRSLVRAALDFLEASHPAGMTMSIWDLNPREMPYLEEHISAVVNAVFAGVKNHVREQPVDPLLMLSLLYNESRFSPFAMSPAGALGMAQFMPETALEYGLSPIARIEVWQDYRALRDSERAKRAARRQAYLQQFGMTAFSADAAIRVALATEDMDVLADYQALVNEERQEQTALQEYVDAIRSDLSAYDFFGDGREALFSLDARTTYAAITAAVDYMSRRLSENSGMATSAIAAYNAGPAAVRERNPRSVLYKYGDLPAYPETVLYLQRVLVVYSRMRGHMAKVV
jgi:uncharacterized protein YnzC (UPF0291/DUF896 family)